MEIIWKPRAFKQLKQIGNRGIQERILKAARGLSKFPACSNVRRLVRHERTYRLRVGDWRILFDVFAEIHIISIEEVKKRDEDTY